MMFSRPRNPRENEPDALAASATSDLNRVEARSALVIDTGDSLRRSVIGHPKEEGWIVHGIKGAEQALPLLRNVPYQLIVIDSDLPGIGSISFAQLLHNSKQWHTIPLVLITDSPGWSSATEVIEFGAYPVRKSTWADDLTSVLVSLERSRSIFRPKRSRF